MLYKLSSLLIRHTGASDCANTRFMSLRGAEGDVAIREASRASEGSVAIPICKPGLLRVARSDASKFLDCLECLYPVKPINHWMLVYTSMTVITLCIVFFNFAYANPPQGPNLGQPATAEEIAHWDIGVMPDGEGLPEGKGTAKVGKAIYDKHCASCHGPEGAGGTADPLAGAKMALTSEYPEQTIGSYWPYATTIFDMTRRSKPMTAPGTLTNDEVFAVTAYLLYLNNIIGENDEMNAETLPKIQMPNREGFINVYKLEQSEREN